MKKFKLLLILLLFVVLGVPFTAMAEGENEAPETLEKSKINVYMFRGEGCGFCARALEFFEGIEEEYGKYYNFVTYEVWQNQENAQLMDGIAEYLDEQITGVPFIIIGNKTYPGFQDEWGEDIKNDIVAEYNKSDANRTDIIRDFKAGVERKKDSNSSIISTVLVLGIIGVGVFMFYARRDNDADITYKEVYVPDEIAKEEVVEKLTEKAKVSVEKKSKEKITKKPATKSNTKASQKKKSTTANKK